MAEHSGVKLTHVPYKGNAPAVTDLMGGVVPAMCNNLAGTLPFMKGDSRIRILAVTGKKRSAAAPDVPTFAEAGVPGSSRASGWRWWPRRERRNQIVKTLSDALVKAQQTSAVQERFASFGVESLTGTPAAYDERIKAETAIWTPVLKSLDLKPQ